jgi:hypothetical protein
VSEDATIEQQIARVHRLVGDNTTPRTVIVELLRHHYPFEAANIIRILRQQDMATGRKLPESR